MNGNDCASVDIDSASKNDNESNVDCLNNKQTSGVSYATITTTQLLDNKLELIPTITNEEGREVLVFDEELIELGSNKWQLTGRKTWFCQSSSGNQCKKELKEQIEIVYKQKNQNCNVTKFMNVEYAWRPNTYSHCFVFGHDTSRCSHKKDNVEETKWGSMYMWVTRSLQR
ncbi:hypothetical protein Tco_0524034 [Tanacetum coccineum]